MHSFVDLAVFSDHTIFNAGAAAYRNRKFDEAAKQFDEAVTAPDLKLQEHAYFNRGNTLYYLGESNPDPSSRTETWKKAVQDYEKALEEIKKGNSDKAAELLTSLLKIAPDFYAAHNTLGTIYQRMNRYANSEAEYRRARQLNPRSADPLVNLGSLFIEEAEGRANEGEDVVGKILDDELDILEDHSVVGRTLRSG